MTFVQRIFGQGSTAVQIGTLGRSQQFHNNVIASINGTGLLVGNGTDSLPEARYIKVLALDQDKHELDSFTMPLNSAVVLTVTADTIAQLSTASADVTVQKCGDVGELKTASGDVTIGECGDIDRVQVASGDVTIKRAKRVNSASSMSGDVRVREASPKRTKKT